VIVSEPTTAALLDDENDVDTEITRQPKIGDIVWYIIEEREGLVALPAILHKQQPDGSWDLNYFREGVLVYIDHSSYCGANWSVFQWCWPGEQPNE